MTTIWLLHISHKHGDDHWAYCTREQAYDRLAQWCKEWWGEEVGDEPMPEDTEELIAAYFEAVSWDESYDIVDLALLGELEAVP